MKPPKAPFPARITTAQTRNPAFAETNWSMVWRAGHSSEPGAEAALESLCRVYWYPVYARVRGHGPGPEDARDLTQEFFAMLLRRESLNHVSQEKGRFRTFLIRSLNNFLVDRHRSRTAGKRGGGQILLEIDAFDPEKRYQLEPATQDTPDAAFDRRWGQMLVIKAIEHLAEEQTTNGNATVFAMLAEFIGQEPDPGEYQTVANRLGVPLNTVAVMVRRLRVRCRELIMHEIMRTVRTRGEAEEELRALFGK